ncbi:MAG: hypothetical protein ABR921_08435 [Candidatus Sulfotelmatobacter sp.]|jgi:hypothetical protein
MCRLMSAWVLLCGLTMMQPSVSQAPQETGARKDIDLAFGGNKVVVLVIAPAKSAHEDDNSEAHGDWADYLNGFSSSAPADTKIIRLTPAKYRQVVEEPKIRRDFATVFLRDSTHSLLYDGMILEPKVYKLGLAWLHQHPDDKEMAAYGLQERPSRLK